MRQTRREHTKRWRSPLLICALILPALLLHGQPLQAQTGTRLFPETGKSVRGSFLQYWETHGGLMQQGYPISEELQERSDTDGKTYTVQYFERAVFELHPENKPPYDVLLSQLGTFRYGARYTAQLQPLPPAVIRSEGVLYIQSEYYQAQGLSIWKASQPSGGYFQELTTNYEWWLDAQNPYRFRRASTEMLENGPVQIGADGSNGVDAWWELNVERKITTPVYHQGPYPSEEQMTFDGWINIFSRSGQLLLERVKSNEAQQVGEEERVPWGKLLIIRTTNAQNGLVRISAVRAEEPHVVVEWTDVDREGKKIQSVRLTRWEWFDTKQLGDGFWLNPPTVDVDDKR